MEDVFSSLPNTAIPVKDGIPVSYGRTVEGSVQSVTSIEEVLEGGRPKSHGEPVDDSNGG